MELEEELELPSRPRLDMEVEGDCGNLHILLNRMTQRIKRPIMQELEVLFSYLLCGVYRPNPEVKAICV